MPTLVALLRNRQLKARAREVLVSYGEPVVDVLAHFMRDTDEDIWVRRHIPTALSQIPSQKSVDVLVAALDEPDGFLRYKVIAALERLRRTDAPLSFPREKLEARRCARGRSSSTTSRCTPTCSRANRSKRSAVKDDSTRRWSGPGTASIACSR